MDGRITLVTATAMEMRAVIQGLGIDKPAPEQGLAVSGRVRNTPVRLVVCGVGPLAAAFTAGQLAGEGLLVPPLSRGILSLGIAGTYDAQTAPIGSVVLASGEVWPEYGLLTGEGADPVALGFPLAGKKTDIDPPPVWNSLPLEPAKDLALMGLNDPATAPRNTDNPPAATGIAVTVAGVSGDAARAAELAGRYAALMENMEGFSLALAARRAGLPFVELRAISNIVGDRSAEAWNIPAALAALSRAVSLVFSL